MRIILSPAKKMRVNTDSAACEGMPVLIRDTEEILAWMKQLSYEQAKKLWSCSDEIAALNYERLMHMDLYRNLTPAILSYEGIAYQYMAPDVFEYGQFDYVQEHLRILSGFYGVLKPLDGVTPYRLEMQAKAAVAGARNLYEYWGDRLYREILDESRVIINLASKEYSKCVERYLKPEDTCITCVFGEMERGKCVQKGVYAKMARGEMVRYMAVHAVEDPEEMKDFDVLGYAFSEEMSSARQYVFLRNGRTKETHGVFEAGSEQLQ